MELSMEPDEDFQQLTVKPRFYKRVLKSSTTETKRPKICVGGLPANTDSFEFERIDISHQITGFGSRSQRDRNEPPSRPIGESAAHPTPLHPAELRTPASAEADGASEIPARSSAYSSSEQAERDCGENDGVLVARPACGAKSEDPTRMSAAAVADSMLTECATEQPMSTGIPIVGCHDTLSGIGRSSASEQSAAGISNTGCVVSLKKLKEKIENKTSVASKDQHVSPKEKSTKPFTCSLCGKQYKIQKFQVAHTAKCAPKVSINNLGTLVKKLEKSSRAVNRIQAAAKEVAGSTVISVRGAAPDRFSKTVKTKNLNGTNADSGSEAVNASRADIAGISPPVGEQTGVVAGNRNVPGKIASRPRKKVAKDASVENQPLLLRLEPSIVKHLVTARARELLSTGGCCSQATFTPMLLRSRIPRRAAAAAAATSDVSKGDTDTAVVDTRCPRLWDLAAACSAKSEGHEAAGTAEGKPCSSSLSFQVSSADYYVPALMPPLSPCKVKVGSKLKQWCAIPGREEDSLFENIASNCGDSSGKEVADLVSSLSDQPAPAGHNKHDLLLKELVSDIMPGYEHMVGCRAYSDMVVLAADGEIPCHSFVFASKCPWVLQSVGDDRCLVIASVRKESLLMWLKFIYTGQQEYLQGLNVASLESVLNAVRPKLRRDEPAIGTLVTPWSSGSGTDAEKARGQDACAVSAHTAPPDLLPGSPMLVAQADSGRRCYLPGDAVHEVMSSCPAAQVAPTSNELNSSVTPDENNVTNGHMAASRVHGHQVTSPFLSLSCSVIAPLTSSPQSVKSADDCAPFSPEAIPIIDVGDSPDVRTAASSDSSLDSVGWPHGAGEGLATVRAEEAGAHDAAPITLPAVSTAGEWEQQVVVALNSAAAGATVGMHRVAAGAAALKTSTPCLNSFENPSRRKEDRAMSSTACGTLARATSLTPKRASMVRAGSKRLTGEISKQLEDRCDLVVGGRPERVDAAEERSIERTRWGATSVEPELGESCRSACAPSVGRSLPTSLAQSPAAACIGMEEHVHASSPVVVEDSEWSSDLCCSSLDSVDVPMVRVHSPSDPSDRGPALLHTVRADSSCNGADMVVRNTAWTTTPPGPWSTGACGEGSNASRTQPRPPYIDLTQNSGSSSSCDDSEGIGKGALSCSAATADAAHDGSHFHWERATAAAADMAALSVPPSWAARATNNEYSRPSAAGRDASAGRDAALLRSEACISGHASYQGMLTGPEGHDDIDMDINGFEDSFVLDDHCEKDVHAEVVKAVSTTPHAPRKALHPPTIPSPFTPMLPYDTMDTPQLKKEVSKYGVKPQLSRKRMVLLLHDIYRQTHQYETDTSAELSAIDGACGNTGASANAQSTTEMPLPREGCRLEHLPGPSAISGEDCHISVSSSSSDETSSVEEMLEESYMPAEDDEPGACSQKVPTADVDMQLLAYFRADSLLHQKVVKYEPLEFDELMASIKERGIQCSAFKLMNFCDDKCITYTMRKRNKGADGRHSRKHRWTAKKPT